MIAVTPDGFTAVAAVTGGFLIHLFYFGRAMGRLETTVKHLGNSFDDFKSHHYIPRSEYEARHSDLLKVIESLAREGRDREQRGAL